MSGETPARAAATPPESWFTPGRFALALALALAAGFFPVLTGSRAFFFFDYGVLGYPFAQYHREQFWSGNFIPLWNPLSNCGAPFLAQWGTMALYPGSLFYLLLPLPWSLGVFCLLHLFLAGLGMYRLAHTWWGDRLGAAVAGFGFVFGGAALASLIWPNYTVALGWMPWVIWLTERAWREGGARRIAVAALAGGMQMMSGVPELVLFTWLILAVVWVIAVVRRAGPPGTLLARALAVGALIAGLSLAQLLPFLELLADSQRHAGFATAKWALPLWGGANLIVPLFHNYRNLQGTFIQQDQYFLMSYYAGLGVLLLAALGALGRRDVRVRALAVLAVLGVVLAWGERGHVYAWLRAAVPALGVGRYPVKFVFLTAFLLPLLAGAGVVWLRERAATAGSLRALGVGSGILVLIAGFLVWRGFHAPVPFEQPSATAMNTLVRLILLAAVAAVAWMGARAGETTKARLFGLVLLALLAADGLTHKPGLNPTLPSRTFAPGIVELNPKPQSGDGRVFISPAAEGALLRSTVADMQTDFIGKRLALWSNLNLLEAAPKVNGSSTLQLLWQRQVQDLLYATNAPELPALLDFLGVVQATAPGKVVDWTPRTNAMPLVTIGQKPVFADASNTLAALTAPDFTPREVAFLPPEAQTAVKAGRSTAARVVCTEFSAHRVAVEVDSPERALLVVAQSFHKPWKAYVDGEPAQVWRANHAFQAVELPAGARQIVLAYEDHAFRGGAAASIASLLVCGLLIARDRRLRAAA